MSNKEGGTQERQCRHQQASQHREALFTLAWEAFELQQLQLQQHKHREPRTFPSLRGSAAGPRPSGTASFRTKGPAAPRSLRQLRRLRCLRRAAPALPHLPDASTFSQRASPTSHRRPSEPFAPLDSNILQWSPETPLTLPRGPPSSLTCGVPPPGRRATPPISCVLCSTTLPASNPSMVSPNSLLEPSCQPLRPQRSVWGALSRIVVGDFLRRLVAHSLAQQFAPTFEAATNPHQYALSTRAGSEALVHSLQAACDGDPSLTVLSVHGVGAFDLISRQAMLTAFRNASNANAILPFVRLFHGSPSEFVWTDSASNPHRVLQAEGGEQGDLLMPALFALGSALRPPCVLCKPTSSPRRAARESDFCDQLLQQLAGPACHIRCLASLQGAAVVRTNHGLTVPA
ncbi:unnamed protein product [Symbiodinium sp. CCMP2592]|nr:unnamed protein product [Symbiodinium sp. CCMP2592]